MQIVLYYLLKHNENLMLHEKSHLGIFINKQKINNMAEANGNSPSDLHSASDIHCILQEILIFQVTFGSIMKIIGSFVYMLRAMNFFSTGSECHQSVS